MLIVIVFHYQLRLIALQPCVITGRRRMAAPSANGPRALLRSPVPSTSSPRRPSLPPSFYFIHIYACIHSSLACLFDTLIWYWFFSAQITTHIPPRHGRGQPFVYAVLGKLGETRSVAVFIVLDGSCQNWHSGTLDPQKMNSWPVPSVTVESISFS